MIRSVVRGVGAYLPSRIVTNDELSGKLDTSDAWIRDRTGIRERRIAAEGELTSDLAAAAARRALERADVSPTSVDLLIVATSTPDNTFPATAAAVQRKLGMPPAIAFDQQAVCAGFPYALATADAYLRVGLARRALVIGAETFSRILDWTDRSTCVLFGDGTDGRGVLGVRLGADGRDYESLYVDGGPSSTGTVGHVRMNGREVFRQAVQRLASCGEEVLAASGLTVAALDWMVPHQANLRIIDAVGRRLGIDPSRVVVTVDRHANTSAASIPLALDAAVADARLRPGHLVLVNALGGGFAWGAALIRW
jgi:3-oxoacyl-[acyl-carrier-protein] synthase-3